VTVWPVLSRETRGGEERGREGGSLPRGPRDRQVEFGPDARVLRVGVPDVVERADVIGHRVSCGPSEEEEGGLGRVESVGEDDDLMPPSPGRESGIGAEVDRLPDLSVTTPPDVLRGEGLVSRGGRQAGRLTLW
jgi:hypothetical protein